MTGPARRARHTGGAGMDFGDTDPSAWRGDEHRMHVPASEVTFSRRELDRLLRLYCRKVAAGGGREYAIDFLKEPAGLSGFPRPSHIPRTRTWKNTIHGC